VYVEKASLILFGRKVKSNFPSPRKPFLLPPFVFLERSVHRGTLFPPTPIPKVLSFFFSFFYSLFWEHQKHELQLGPSSFSRDVVSPPKTTRRWMESPPPPLNPCLFVPFPFKLRGGKIFLSPPSPFFFDRGDRAFFSPSLRMLADFFSTPV